MLFYKKMGLLLFFLIFLFLIFFQFSVPLSNMGTRTLWLSVWHSDTFGRNDFLGEVMLPMGDVALDDGGPRWYTLQERVRFIFRI